MRLMIFAAVVVTAVLSSRSGLASRKASAVELKSLKKLCKQLQLREVIADQIYLLEVENPQLRGSYLIPTRNTWLSPPTLELQLATFSKVLTGLPSPLWKEEREGKFDKLDAVKFLDLDRDGFTDLALQASILNRGVRTPVFRALLNDGQAGFRLEEKSGLGGAFRGSLEEFVSAVGDFYRKQEGPRSSEVSKTLSPAASGK